MPNEKEPTQRTQPKKGEPVEIPVPTRDQVFGDLAKASQPLPAKPKKRKVRHQRKPGR